MEGILYKRFISNQIFPIDEIILINFFKLIIFVNFSCNST